MSIEKSEIWVSNPIGKDFKIDVPHLPRVGDHFEVEHEQFVVEGIVYRPLTVDYEKTNECVISIALKKTPE